MLCVIVCYIEGNVEEFDVRWLQLQESYTVLGKEHDSLKAQNEQMMQVSLH